MNRTHSGNKYVQCCLWAMLLIYMASIVWINFSITPGFYDADMYSDILYAVRVWEERTLFPQNWVFGNQLNVVSAPVLAALVYGIFDQGIFVAMAWASTLMTLAVLWSFDWMLRPAMEKREQRLLCLVIFMAVVLYCGNAVDGNQGWNLFFTMCSYYAGYSLTAFLAFGCYLRSGQFDRKLAAILAVTCLLSFGTGIQSIRQTAIMVVPLAAAEGIRILSVWIQKKRLKKAPLITVAAMTMSNLAGLACARLVQINQVEILGAVELSQSADWLRAIADCVLTVFQMLMTGERISYLILGLLFLICVCAVCILVKQLRQKSGEKMATLGFLLLMGVLVIAAIDVLTTMHVWARYYFLLFPLIGVLAVCCYIHCGQRGKAAVLAFTAMLFGLSCVEELLPLREDMAAEKQKPVYEVCSWLEENEYEYLFSVWGHAEGVAVASEGKIMVGFWNLQETPFVPMGYLYDPVIFEAEPEKCAYLFEGAEAVSIGRQAAEKKGARMELIGYFEEYDWYLFIADINLMCAYA